MGNVTSRPDDPVSTLHLRDQQRLAVTSVRITNAKNRVLYTILPNTYPATKYTVRKEGDDDSLLEFVQDAELSASGAPNFFLKLRNDDDIFFYFTFQMRQEPSLPVSNPTVIPQPALDTHIKNLTFVFSSTPRDLDTLITREFNADPNLHKNPNVDLVGDYSTAGQPIEQFEWMWKWRPPKATEDRGGGWRNTCSFAEYDQRAHRLSALVTFSFWVHSTQRQSVSSPSRNQSPRMELAVPNIRTRLPSSQSIDSRLSDSDTELKDKEPYKEPPSPISAIPEYGIGLEPEMIPETFQVDINTRQADEDISGVEDGPLFRSTMRQLEGKTGTMKARMKNVLKKAQSARETHVAATVAYNNFLAALREAASSNANAVKPALDHYFEKIATEILSYEEQQSINLQRLIIDPLARIYNNDIKQSESKKKVFDEGSREYYAYVSKYLGQRQESLKDKKRAEKDSKYQTRRKDFELKRFDYSSFMQDLHGGRKDQEVLSHLTRYADAQAKGYLASAKKVEVMIPQLEALCFEVKEADKQYLLLRTKSEERRRAIEKGDKNYADVDDNVAFMPPPPSQEMYQEVTSPLNGTSGLAPSSSLSDRSRSIAASATTPNGVFATGMPPLDPNMSPVVLPADALSTSPSNKFKNTRDIEPQELLSSPASQLQPQSSGQSLPQIRKEGLLWSMSRPGTHSDPKALNKNAWHKFWIVLDQGKISEYINWKQALEQHMDPIDLRMASVREARNAERRFCFEVLTPTFTRVYQATGEDDMRSWMSAINNALQTAFETKFTDLDRPSPVDPGGSNSIAKDLFGKSSSFHGHRATASSITLGGARGIGRHSTVGDKPQGIRSSVIEERPTHLLNSIRAADPGNLVCADCGSDSRVEWVSINLGLIVCIDCSGIHRSLGTHVSKIRSLTLDTTSFTQDVVELISSIGNRVSNMVYEAQLDLTTKPVASHPREVRQRFIQQKYVDKTYVMPIAASSQFQTADETLLASIKRNDIQNVLYALALGANPNVLDRVRSNPALFLALAAADPASPSGSTDHSRSSSATTLVAQGGNTTTEQPPRKSFPIAELLLQNGGELLAASTSPMPLSRSARQFLDYKLALKAGRAIATNPDAPLSSSPRDGFVGITSSDSQKKDRERLLKRTSGAGVPRFMGRS